MNKILLWFLGCMILASVTTVYAVEKDDILGVWLNQEKDAKIEIITCEEKYCGKIVWLKEPNYLPDSKDGIPGTPKLDHNNPDEALRKVPVIGLQIVHGLTYTGKGRWKKGRIYDPKNGKTYSAKIKLVDPHQLDLRGYIGISLLGRTATWTR